MIFGITANPSIRAVNLFIYLCSVYCSSKVEFFSQLLRYVNACKHDVYFTYKDHQIGGNIFFLLRICCQCKYGVKIIFDVFAQLVIVLQTQSLTYGQIRSTQFKGSICYTCKAIFSPSKFNNLSHLYCNRKVVSNMQLFCTFAMVLDFLKSPSSLLCVQI